MLFRYYIVITFKNVIIYKCAQTLMVYRIVIVSEIKGSNAFKFILLYCTLFIMMITRTRYW